MPHSVRASILLCLFLGLVVPQNTLAQDVKGLKTVTHRGNTFLISPEKRDTVYRQSEMGETIMYRVTDPFVISMNGDTVYSAEEVTKQPVNRTGQLVFEEYLLSSLEPYAKILPNGRYMLSLSEVIVDKAGKVVYYNYDGLRGQDSSGRRKSIPDTVYKAIKSETEEIIQKAPQLHPAKIGRKSVVAYYITDINKYRIEVADGVVTWAKKEQ